MNVQRFPSDLSQFIQQLSQTCCGSVRVKNHVVGQLEFETFVFGVKTKAKKSAAAPKIYL
jgi:hypothetical protein